MECLFSVILLKEELKVKTILCLAHLLKSYRDFPLSVSIPETTTETYTANGVKVIAYFLCPETLTALLLL